MRKKKRERINISPQRKVKWKKTKSICIIDLPFYRKSQRDIYQYG